MKIKYPNKSAVNVVCGISRKGLWALKPGGAFLWDAVEKAEEQYVSVSCEKVISDLAADPPRLNAFYSAMGEIEMQLLHKQSENDDG
ncbi:MAG: hypothetical protein HY360_15565 [Verrucomicrobia bacterium]|nr:hypothetical protein [Verrucomicrobiota bacterium]